MEYGDMLDRALERMPDMVFEKKRFEVPKAKTSREGKKTIFKNYKEIADYLQREPKHLLKFLGKELGAAWRKEGGSMAFIGRFSPQDFNERIEKYVKLYILCPVCGKPDTELTRVDRVPVLKCLACGAKNSVPPQ